MIKENYDLLVIAGTYDSHEIIEKLQKYNIPTLATVTTQMGKEILSNLSIDVLVGKLSKDAFKNLIYTKKIKCILDTSHPYAKEVTQNIVEISNLLNIPYVRYLRPSENTNFKNITYADTVEETIKILNNLKGNILLTTGSKDLELFVNGIKDYKEHLFVRVLPTSEAIQKCEKLKIPIKNIIAIMGCFSIDINREIMRYYKINVLVTKDGGKVGGFCEKVIAAQQLELDTIVIKRPTESSLSVSTYQQAVDFVISKLHKKGDVQII